jgi:DNA (cytosine-5)-methyltransferase 1
MQFGALVIDAKWFVPQSRPRVFVVAVDAEVACDGNFRQEPVPAWTPKSLSDAYSRLPASLKSLWRWWNLAVPSGRTHSLAKIIERKPTGVNWHTRKETAYLLSLMNDTHRAKVREAQGSGKRQIGFVYKRMREEADGKNTIDVQRAEIRFDGLDGAM